MVALGSSIRHHLAANGGAGLLLATRRVLSPGLGFSEYDVAGHARFGGPGISLRSLHHLSASSDSPDSQRAGGTRRAISPHQRKRRGYDCRSGYAWEAAF